MGEGSFGNNLDTFGYLHIAAWVFKIDSMKNIFTLFSFFLLCNGGLKAQSYIPIPFDTSTYWIVEVYLNPSNYNVPFYCESTNSMIYYYGDTVIDNLKYAHLKAKFCENYYCGQNKDGDIMLLTFPFLRQDTANQILYGRNNWQPSTERKLIDFKQQKGDTLIAGMYHEYILPQSFVESVDSVLLKDGLYHKRIILPQYYFNRQFIEGVGTDFGVGTSTNDFEGRSINVLCFQSNGKSIYNYYTGQNNCPRCSTNVFSTIDELEVNYRTYPNPFNGQIYIDVPDVALLKLYDVSGRVVFETYDVVSGVPVSVPASLTNGFYVAEVGLLSGNSLSRVKLVKE